MLSHFYLFIHRNKKTVKYITDESMKVKQIVWFLVVLSLTNSLEGFGNGGSGNLIQNVVTAIAGTPGVEGEGPYEAFDHPVISPGESSYYAAPKVQALAPQIYTAHVAPIQVQAQAIPLHINTRVISNVQSGSGISGGGLGGSGSGGGNQVDISGALR